MRARRLLTSLTLLLAVSLALTVIQRWPPAARAQGTPAAMQPSCTAERIAATLTTQQRLGQLFMVGLRSGVTGAQAAETDVTITERNVGNAVFYGTGWGSATTIRDATRRLQRLAQGANRGIHLYIAGNQEGGQQGAFQAFYGEGFSGMPSPITQAQGDPARLQEQARIWGVQLSSAGINLNLAPVLDTVPPGTQIENSPIGFWGRQYGFTTEEVIRYGLAFARGMMVAPLDVSVKHFPGLGRVEGNTDFTAQGNEDEEFSGLDDPYLAPYQAAIDAGVPFVMMSLAIYPRVDRQPAAFSSTIIRDILRAGLGFGGVVISDDVGLAEAVKDRTPAQRALDFFGAGGDMLLTVLPSDIAPMMDAVSASYSADPAFKRSIDTSVMRVLRAKEKAGLLPKTCD